MTASHCPWVTSYLPKSNGRLIRTRVSRRSDSSASGSVEPIRNSPGRIRTNSIPSRASRIALARSSARLASASAAAFSSSARFSSSSASR